MSEQQMARLIGLGFYVFMLVFDFAILAGTVWLIGWNGWSAWWMLLAVFLTESSNPHGFLKEGKKS